MGPHRCVGYVALLLLLAHHPMAFDRLTSPEDLGSSPPEGMAIVAISTPQDEELQVQTLGWLARRRRSRRRSRRRRECKGPHKHHIQLHVYTIMSKHASSGISNKNAADTLGDIAFIFGSRGVPTPRGVEQYYDDGIISMNRLSVSSWGSYLQCNHPHGSTKYTCKCPKYHVWGPCDMKRAGKEQNSHTNGHVWYSFPEAGKGTYWDYEHGRGCGSIQVRASCVINALAKKAGCPGKCNAHNAKACVRCVNKLTNAQKEHVWDRAVLQKQCPDSRRRRSMSTSNASTVMWGGLASTEVVI